MSNLKILLAVLALTAVPVANVAAQQVIMMPLLSQEVAMVNVTGDSNFCKPGTYVSKKVSQGRIPTYPTQPPAPSTSGHQPASIYY
ncbi:MAG: hypothetical protein GYA32_04010 [Serratia sp.]|nr:hypothetical protein [Serratia sp. (in: enterobacteria)]